MQQQKNIRLDLSLTIVLSILIITFLSTYPLLADNQQGSEKKPSATKPNRTDIEQLNSSTDNSKKKKEGNQETSTAKKGKQQAISLLEGVLSISDQISPIEYRILTEVEAATILWQLDKTRATTLLKSVIERLRAIQNAKPPTTTERIDEITRKRLNLIVLRKIAALQPDLIKTFWPESFSSDKMKESWSVEGQALMSVAYDQIDTDPKLASRLAAQSLSYGFEEWERFLQKLRLHDPLQAEQAAIVLINRLRDSSISAGAFREVQNFVFDPASSTGLQDQFFQSLSIRLGRDARPDLSVEDLQTDLLLAQDMVRLAAASSSRWSPQFQNLVAIFESQFKERSLPYPAPPRRRMIDVSDISPATPGDTQEITDALAQASTIKDSQARDKMYQNLASKAALHADFGLADQIMSRINDDDVRKATTLLIFSPPVRKAIQDKDWAQAQKQAINIRDPLARTLVFVRIAKAMDSSVKDKNLIKEAFALAMAQLQREWFTGEVAKAFLIIAKSLYPLDSESGLETIRSAVMVLNKIRIQDEPLGGAPINSAVATWINYTNYSMDPGEIVDLTQLLSDEFRYLAKQDKEQATSVANGIQHRGLCSLARLAISKTLLEQSSTSSGVKQKTEKAQ